MRKVSARVWGGLAVAAFLIAAAWLVRESLWARDAARMTQCSGQISALAYGMHVYHDEHGGFPPAYIADEDGNPMHSWRVLLLKYLDGELYQQYRFDEPWDSPNNRLVGEQMPNAYVCPCDPDAKREHRTNYFVVVGDETPFPGASSITLDDVTTENGDTILLVESATMQVHWLEPRDLSIDAMSFEVNDFENPSVSSYHLDRANARCVDGTPATMYPDGPYAESPAPVRQRFRIRAEK